MRVVHNRMLRLLTVAVFALAAFLGTTEASPLITVTPTSQSIALGGTATVDIVLSGLAATDTVGGFSFLLSFNDTIISGIPLSLILDPDSKMGAAPLNLSGGFSTASGGSPLDAFFLADGLISEAALKLSEGSGFRLATMTFTGLSAGTSQLTLTTHPLTGVFLSDYSGFLEVPATAVNGSICVDASSTTANPCVQVTSVPEPSSVALMFVGLAGLATFAIRRHRLLTEV